MAFPCFWAQKGILSSSWCYRKGFRGLFDAQRAKKHWKKPIGLINDQISNDLRKKCKKNEKFWKKRLQNSPQPL